MRKRKTPLCRVEEVDEPAKAGGTAQTSRASGFLATEACTPRGVATHLGKHWLNEPTAITHKAGNSNSESDLSLGARCGQDLSLQQPVVKVPASHRGRRGAPMARRDPPPPRLRRGLAEVRGCESVPRTKADDREPGPPPRVVCAVGWQYRAIFEGGATQPAPGSPTRQPRWGGAGMHRRSNAAGLLPRAAKLA